MTLLLKRQPNLLSKDGTASLATTAFSRSGEYFAYGISRSVSSVLYALRKRKLKIVQGSDFYTIYVRPTSEPLAVMEGAEVSHDDKRLSDEIRFVKFSSVSWTHDSKGFFYQVINTLQFFIMTFRAYMLLHIALSRSAIPWICLR